MEDKKFLRIFLDGGRGKQATSRDVVWRVRVGQIVNLSAVLDGYSLIRQALWRHIDCRVHSPVNRIPDRLPQEIG